MFPSITFGVFLSPEPFFKPYANIFKCIYIHIIVHNDLVLFLFSLLPYVLYLSIFIGHKGFYGGYMEVLSA